jgi:RNA polymerase-interacting CarD/CdnL/TRCF family regulator
MAKVVKMDFHKGDSVVHWIYGLGKILRIEEKDLSGQTSLYYVVQLKDLTVWVPVDGELMNRVRPPTPKDRFTSLLEILKGQSQILPVDRYERRTFLEDELRKGSAEANCRVIRDLSAFKQTHQLNDYDLLILNRTRASLLGEWTYSQSISLEQAETELHDLMGQGTDATLKIGLSASRKG